MRGCSPSVACLLCGSRRSVGPTRGAEVPHMLGELQKTERASSISTVKEAEGVARAYAEALPESACVAYTRARRRHESPGAGCPSLHPQHPPLRRAHAPTRKHAQSSLHIEATTESGNSTQAQAPPATPSLPVHTFGHTNVARCSARSAEARRRSSGVHLGATLQCGPVVVASVPSAPRRHPHTESGAAGRECDGAGGRR